MNEYSFKGSSYDDIVLFFGMFSDIFVEYWLLKLKILFQSSQERKTRIPFIMFSKQPVYIFANADNSR